MQKILLSFQQDLFVYHAGAGGKTPHTKERVQPLCMRPPRRAFEGSHVSMCCIQHKARLVRSMRRLMLLMVRC